MHAHLPHSPGDQQLRQLFPCGNMEIIGISRSRPSSRFEVSFFSNQRQYVRAASVQLAGMPK
jgi:hypothetical protein